MARKTSLLNRYDDYVDTWFDRIVRMFASKEAPVTPPIEYTWWFVANRVTTGMVITDQARSIVIAPIEWNRFIGTTLDLLLGQVHAQAVLIPGPHRELPR